ncbi:hypothetical protein LCGC14_0977060 [marine sediment metagenome]|uniref:Uncharacterized protein n=1 Tax=marine sediment metagenome TaxID=412755 RepID=A0A0F9NW77_9ZZZZ|nr:MAG: hypothetical protein Lokiarch_15720 [Candidatus Lokiarchaeum sp. GC14_75]
MSEEFKALVDSSYDKGTPFWIHTSDYIFGMVPTDDDRWVEVSYTFEEPDEPFYKTERDADLSFQFLLEEVEKGVTFYVKDLKVPLLKEFANSLESQSGAEKMNAIISELISNAEKYSANFPIIKSKDQLNILKERV